MNKCEPAGARWFAPCHNAEYQSPDRGVVQNTLRLQAPRENSIRVRGDGGVTVGSGLDEHTPPYPALAAPRRPTRGARPITPEPPPKATVADLGVAC